MMIKLEFLRLDMKILKETNYVDVEKKMKKMEEELLKVCC